MVGTEQTGPGGALYHEVSAAMRVCVIWQIQAHDRRYSRARGFEPGGCPSISSQAPCPPNPREVPVFFQTHLGRPKHIDEAERDQGWGSMGTAVAEL